MYMPAGNLSIREKHIFLMCEAAANNIFPLTAWAKRDIILSIQRGAFWLRGSARFDPQPDLDNASVG
jgi:hypothetical protein